jgi:phage FluMu protein Com
MSSIKCPNCRLSNFTTDVECRRCGKLLYRPTDRIISERPPRRYTLISLLIFVVIAAAGYYIYSEIKTSVDHVGEKETKRVASKPRNNPDAGLSRSEADRQKSQRIANAVGASSGLAAHTNRTQQTEKAIQQLSNSQQP